MKLIIAGGRDYGCNYLENGEPDHIKNDEQYDYLCIKAQEIIGPEEDVEIISGLARGTDMLGCRFAEEYGYPLRGFAAEWGKFGKAAGPVRNKLMAKNATHLLAFWDYKSRGTRHMIDYATSLGLQVKVVKYE